jgi:hypothetical protein
MQVAFNRINYIRQWLKIKEFPEDSPRNLTPPTPE